MTIILIVVTLLNAVYFTDVYNDGSENLSSKQSQQLIILNSVSCFLLFVALICISYICMNDSDKFKNLTTIEGIFNKKKEELDNKIDEMELIKDEQNKKEKTREEITQIVKTLEESKTVVQKESKTLKEQNNNLQSKIIDLKVNYGSLHEEHKNLTKTNKQLEEELIKHKQIIDEMDKNLKLKEELELSRKNEGSILTEGPQYEDDVESDSQAVDESIKNKSNLFDNSHKVEGVPIPSLFPENASLDQILEEIPRTSILSNDYNKKEYDYGINIKREQKPESTTYESFNYTKKSPEENQINRNGYFSYQKSSVNNPVQETPKSDYKPYTHSFLKKALGTY